MRADDAEQFEPVLRAHRRSSSISADELARLGTEVSPAAGREWGDNDANRSVRKALNKDLEQLAELYAERAHAHLRARSTTASTRPPCWLSVLAALAVMLASPARW